MTMRKSVSLFVLTFMLVIPANGLRGQTADWRGPQATASREELREWLSRFEAVAASRAYTRDVRAEAEQEAAEIRSRLDQGDFNIGDYVLLTVQNEPQLTDTFVVAPGPALKLPLVGTISMRGVLRSELQEHLTREIGRMVHDPVITARAMIRLSILGQVNEPGFYLFPVEMALADAMMRVGGPTQEADIPESKIERSGTRIWEGERFQSALVEGRTLEELHLRTGDRIFVQSQPEEGQGSGYARFLLPVVPALLVTLINVF